MTTPGSRPSSTSGDPFDVGLDHELATTTGGAPGGTVAPPSTEPGAGTAPAAQPARHTGRTIGRTLALALLITVTVLLVLFVVFNTQTVDISLVFGNVTAPLVLALLIAAALGGLVVAFAGAALRARRRNR